MLFRSLNSIEIPQATEAKYLGMHLDRRLTWKSHIFKKRKQLSIQLRKMYWLLGRKSPLSLENKLLIYKCILKPVWCYGIQLWGTAASSNIDIIQRFQSKMLRLIANAPWYMSNIRLHKELNIPSIRETIMEYTQNYKNRITNHPNTLAKRLMNVVKKPRRLKRRLPQDLVT